MLKIFKIYEPDFFSMIIHSCCNKYVIYSPKLQVTLPSGIFSLSWPKYLCLEHCNISGKASGMAWQIMSVNTYKSWNE